ncbi:hypothetical protein BDV95DRAFT_612605 [Massariosphaeria phaeospora]|uniref:Fungal-specific transcription factor domain-containing protein n=1 Tax=Massariosphaeria phaeospora TaxID=100035 RepID=A0A7C8M4I3_9PLEO|nr:hypothetical protein BDV95DRAFT_612605 [Massariosphaeria phaeospora]
MEVDLSSIDILETLDDDPTLLNAITATLQSPQDSETKARQVTDSILLYCAEAYSSTRLSGDLTQVWWILTDIACLVPPNHPWQDTLVEAVRLLRTQGGEATAGHRLWSDLPDLSLILRDKWYDPTTEPALREITPEDLSKWQNLNSFTARLTDKHFSPWLNFPIWEIRNALEDAPASGAAMRCRLWVACEWILRCGDVLFDSMCTREELDENSARVLSLGQLSAIEDTDIAPLSVERWAFWKKRLVEIGAGRGELQLGDSMCGRILDTLQHMANVEKGYE